MDITERRRAEETLRAKETQVRLITDTAPVMLSTMQPRRALPIREPNVCGAPGSRTGTDCR